MGARSVAGRRGRPPERDNAVVGQRFAGSGRYRWGEALSMHLHRQPWVLRHHVEYYLTSVWETTGRTSADMDQIANRYPLIHVDASGGLTILTGHHRSAAALLEGRPVLARIAVAEGAELPASCSVTT
jgi:hypothetical protein